MRQGCLPPARAVFRGRSSLCLNVIALGPILLTLGSVGAGMSFEGEKRGCCFVISSISF